MGIMKTERVYEGTNFITGLRAVAVLLVFLVHSGGGGLKDLGGPFAALVDFGKFGVPMFFVISGFTVFYQLFERNYQLKGFLQMRLSRISIPYFPLLLIVYAYISLGGAQFNGWAVSINGGYISPANLLAHFSYLAGFSTRFANTIIGVEWSLHIEVFFYCTLGVMIAWGWIRPAYRSMLLALSVSAAIAVALLALGYLGKLDRLLVHWMPFRYAWMFILGGAGQLLRNVFAARNAEGVRHRASDFAMILVCACFIGLLFLQGPKDIAVLQEALVAVLTFVLIVTVRDYANLSRVLTNRPALFLGSISFSFYLWHFIIIHTGVAETIFSLRNQTVVFFLNLAISLAVSYGWYLLFEIVLYQRVKDYINRGRGSAERS